MNPRCLQLAAVCLAALAVPSAEASFHLFRIDQVYSNADGNVQYVVMHESTGSNGEHLWNQQQFETTNRAGIRKQLRFPSNLPSASTAGRSVLIATPGFAALGLVAPDYTIPARFIPTDGGKLEFAGGVDEITLPALPSDGATAINRNGTPVGAAPKNFADAVAVVPALPVGSIEFHHATLNHYFISALAADIDALDSGRIAGWTRTGRSFNVFPSLAAAAGGANPVCRIIIPPPYGDSHFFSASPQECADTLAKYPFMSQETPGAFFVALPATGGPNAGACPTGTIPVYRVFNNRPDANHRYTTDRGVRDLMVSLGGTAEGYGNDAVIMCAPPGTSTTP